MLAVVLLGCAGPRLAGAERPPAGAAPVAEQGQQRLPGAVRQHNFSHKAAVSSLAGGSFLQEDMGRYACTKGQKGGESDATPCCGSAATPGQRSKVTEGCDCDCETSSIETMPELASPSTSRSSSSASLERDANGGEQQPSLAKTKITTVHGEEFKSGEGGQLQDSGLYDDIKRILQDQEETVFTHPNKVEEYRAQGQTSFQTNDLFKQNLGLYVQRLDQLDHGASIVTQKEWVLHDALARTLARLLHEGTIAFDHHEEQGYMKKAPGEAGHGDSGEAAYAST